MYLSLMRPRKNNLQTKVNITKKLLGIKRHL